MSDTISTTQKDHVLVVNPTGASRIVLVCEHASHFIPPAFNNLGLSEKDRISHAAWDPGAMALSERLSKHLDAPLVANNVSRLVYDCNRPPSAPDAMPARSEVIEVPGNLGLSNADRAARVASYYRPFETTLRKVLDQKAAPIIVTIHSFTPVYHGVHRAVEIGVLHDSDTRLADAMLKTAKLHTQANVERNAPYGPENGVTHTLQEHALKEARLNVMLEVRNDLIQTEAQQDDMGKMMAGWIADACAELDFSGAQK